MLDRHVEIGEGLGLHALGGIDEQQHPFAGSQSPRHFIGEVHVSGGIHEVQVVLAPDLILVRQSNGLRLDRDPAFALDVEVVEKLVPKVALGDQARSLNQTIGKRGFSVVDVGDDAEIANLRHTSPRALEGARGLLSPAAALVKRARDSIGDLPRFPRSPGCPASSRLPDARILE